MNLLDYLGIQIEETTATQVRLSLVVTDQHKQPFGLLHGGINAVLIETACSLGANQAVAEDQFAAAIDLQVNHFKSGQTRNCLLWKLYLIESVGKIHKLGCKLRSGQSDGHEKKRLSDVLHLTARHQINGLGAISLLQVTIAEH